MYLDLYKSALAYSVSGWFPTAQNKVGSEQNNTHEHFLGQLLNRMSNFLQFLQFCAIFTNLLHLWHSFLRQTLTKTKGI
jgi:hypothetical protein